MVNKKQLIVRIILFVLISVLLGGGIYTINASNVGNNQMPMPFGLGLGVVMSGSMEPVLSINDVILVKSQDEYHLGEIVVYQANGELIVHEIIKIDGEEITTQGRVTGSPDDPISIKDVKGKVILTLGGLGIVVKIIKMPVITIALLLLSVWLLLKSYAKENEEVNKKAKALDDIRKELEELKQGISKTDTPSNDD
ncbi:MAG: signal peptidase I [Clostridia bacterium]|nr:signal peptidase I [Clostridia bacterium]